jgi:hypothetical protein
VVSRPKLVFENSLYCSLRELGGSLDEYGLAFQLLLAKYHVQQGANMGKNALYPVSRDAVSLPANLKREILSSGEARLG